MLNRFTIRLLYCPRLALFFAAAANLVHPLIHGTVFDSGALDGLILASNGLAMVCVSEDC